VERPRLGDVFVANRISKLKLINLDSNERRQLMLTSTTLLISVLGLFVLVFVFSPLFSKNQKVTASSQPSDWEEQKELIFAQLSDLEYDYQMDKVTERDYEKAKEELMAKAAPFLEAQKMDIQTIEQEVDEEIDQYLQKMKEASGQEVRHEH
jgi:cytochrome c-type biogenesis protein CcmI